MFKVGDFIPAIPETLPERQLCNNTPQRAKVKYIHPEGRFYTIEFTFKNGASFRETRYFTEREKEEGRQAGLFKASKRRSRESLGCPKGYSAADFDVIGEGEEQAPWPSFDDSDIAAMC